MKCNDNECLLAYCCCCYRAFVAKSFATDAAACRETFFSKDLPESDLLRYQKQLAACSPVRLLDLRDMNAQVGEGYGGG